MLESNGDELRLRSRAVCLVGTEIAHALANLSDPRQWCNDPGVFCGIPLLFCYPGNARHNQNTITRKMDISLPELALTMNRIYPFKNSKNVKPKWYDKIGVSANANARNDINTYDSILFTNQTLSNMKNGARLNVPISTSLNVLKYFTLTPTLNTSSTVYFQTIRKRYDSNVNTIFTDTLIGAQVANEFNANLGLTIKIK